ncbi:trypsin-like peptidase domain-containing protein [Bdellovibrionota bacterium FG-1]
MVRTRRSSFLILVGCLGICGALASAPGAVGAQMPTGPRLLGLKTKEAVARVRPATVNLKALKRNGNNFYQSIGSGILISEDGYILTNEHVVGDSQSIEVTLWRAKEKTYIARPVLIDKKLDLALVKIRPRNGERFNALKMDENIKVRTGDRVLAIGNPFGLSHSVTSGIVGGTGRSISVGTLTYEGLIQTDAPINQGNSGGPLVNLRGELIGINTVILATDPASAAFSGQGFAIPMDTVVNFTAEVIRGRI